MSRAVVEYVQPVSRAIERTKRILFQPFDIAKWFTMGFTVWLAQLLEGHFTSSGVNFNYSEDDFSVEGWEDVVGTAQLAVDSYKDQLHWVIPVAIVVALLGFLISIVLLWLSSRAQFMFLDNVVHNRGLVKQPWHAFRSLGNSLFWWKLIFHCIVISLMLIIIGVPGYFLMTTFDGDNMQPGWIAGVVGASTAGVLAAITLAYIGFLLEDFVVPIMYRHAVPATVAWGRVVDLHGDRPGAILAYALWKLLLVIATGILILIIVIATCCIAGVLISIPYVGTVILLPLAVFFRSLSLEFLLQFGQEFDVWIAPEAQTLAE